MEVNPEMLPCGIPSKKRGLIQPVQFVCKLILHREIVFDNLTLAMLQGT